MNLPKGWKLLQLKEICDLQNGYAFKSTDYVNASNTLNCRMSNIRPSGVFDLAHNPKFLPDFYAEKYSNYLLKDGDVIIAMTDMATEAKILGVPTIVKTEGKQLLLNQRVGKLIIKKPDLIFFPYLKYVLNRKETRLYFLKFSGGGLQINLGKNDLLSVKIPLPPIASQRRIANILDKADEIIRKRKEAIALTEQLQKSIFLDMFGDPVTNPKGWEKVTLGSQILNFKYGTNSKCHDTKETEDLPVLRIPNIIEEKILWEDLKFATVSHKEKQDLLLRENDLLFVRSNGNPEYIGRCALFESSEEVIIYASYLIRGRLKSTSIIKAGFVRDVISFPTYRSVLIKQARTTAGNYNINTQGLKSLEIIKPSVEEQEKYLSITKSINKSITTYYKSLQESENLFNSLLQKAFKGEL